MGMTPKAYAEEERQLKAMISALRRDISNPVYYDEREQTLLTNIETLKRQVTELQERRAKLPELLVTAEKRLEALRNQRPSVSGKVEKLLKLRKLIDELTADLG